MAAEVEDIDFDALEGSSSTKKKSGEKSPGDFPSLFADLFTKINWKMCFFLFIIYILLNSDIFIDRFLSRRDGLVDNMTPTDKGTIVQAILLILLFIIMDAILRSMSD